MELLNKRLLPLCKNSGGRANTFPYIQPLSADLEKKLLFISLKNLYLKIVHNQRWYEMKSYDELKAEMEAIQQQIVEAKKNAC